tara:strand:- start:2621 stop:3040 length:420 start_codon:yes stop_codon:yes gene_type:complete
VKLLRRAWIILGYHAIVMALAGCSSLLPIGSNSGSVDSDSTGHFTQAARESGALGLLGWAGVALIIGGGIVWAVLGNRRRGLLMIAAGATLSVGMVVVLEFLSYLFWPGLIAIILVGVAMAAPWAIRQYRRIRGLPPCK